MTRRRLCFVLMQLVDAKPSNTLAELQEALKGQGLPVVALSTIRLMIRRLGLSHKKRP